MENRSASGRLPTRVAWCLGTASVLLGVAISESLGAGAVGAVIATAVLLAVSGTAFELVAARASVRSQ